VTQSSGERLTIYGRKIFGPEYENDLGWGLRHNEELYELIDKPNIVKYI
jgi:hypothetical protein